MSLLPFNASALERALDKAADLNIDVSAITALWNPWTCQEDALPWLAWAMHITDAEGWRLATTTEQRRALIARSVELHRKKGTPWSIREALKAVGFNDLEIQENLPSNRYDGVLAFSGASHYAAYNWAQFRVVADAGDDQPITAKQTALIIDTINAWKPARSHLVDVQHRASATERVSASEAGQHAGALALEDAHRWGHHFYDGAFAYDQGVLHCFNGTLCFDGAFAHNGFHATPASFLYDGEREADSTNAALGLADWQQCFPLFDAAHSYGGYADFGASAPVAEDPPMQITLRRHRRYDARLTYGECSYDGANHYAGLFTHYGSTPYCGDVLTCLEA